MPRSPDRLTSPSPSLCSPLTRGIRSASPSSALATRKPALGPIGGVFPVHPTSDKRPHWRTVALYAAAVVQSALNVDVPNREDREDRVAWVLRLRTARKQIIAPLAEWGRAGRLTSQFLLAAIDGGALRPIAGFPRRAGLHDFVHSDGLLTLLSSEQLYDAGLGYPPAWRRTLPASVECPALSACGQQATRTRPATAANRGDRVE